MRTQLAAIDLDGTLLDDHHDIPDCNRRAVADMRGAGIRCVIASGRMHDSTTRYADELGLDGPILSYNGAMVRDARTGETWTHVPLPADAAAAIVDFCAARGYHLNYYLNDRLLVAAETKWSELYSSRTSSVVHPVGDLSAYRGSQPTKLILVDTPEETDRLLMRFRAELAGRVYVTKSNPEYLEFMNPDANKGAALALIAQRLGIAQTATAAFGDSDNDIPMLRWAGIGVAMAESGARTREAADAIAPEPAPAGFAEAVRRFILAD